MPTLMSFDELLRVVQNVCVEVFSLDPVFATPDYVTSAVAQQRHGTDFAAPTHRGASRIRLPPWIAEHHRLGPYEKYLLAEVVCGQHRFLVVKGGAGSGKSSTFGHLETVLVGSGPRAIESGAELAGFQPLVRIDLQHIANKELETYSTQSDRDRQSERILDGLGAALLTRIEQQLTPDALAVLLAKIVNPDLRLLTHYGELSTVRGKIRRALRRQGIVPDTWATTSVTDRITLFDDACGTLDSAQHRLIGAILPYAHLARVLEEAGRGLVLVFDNIDPIPEYAQDALVETFSGIQNGPGWGPLRIVLPVRLTTFVKRKNTLHFVSTDHLSPNAAEIAFYRITRFLFAPTRYETFKSLDENTQHAVVARFAMFWLHLADRGGYAWELLSCMSGTNIRDALQVTSAWCRSRLLLPATRQHRDRVEQFRSELAEHLAKHLLLDLGERLGHIICAELRAVTIADEVELDGQDEVGKAIGARIGEEVVEVVRSLEPIRDLREPTGLARTALVVLTDGLSGDDTPGRPGAASSRLAEAVARVRGWRERAGLSEDFDRIIKESVQESLEGLLAAIPSPDMVPEDVPLLARFCREFATWFYRATSVGLERTRTWTRIQRAARDSQTATGESVWPDDWAKFQSVSRFAAASALLVPDPGRTQHVLNVLTLDGVKLEPVALRALYLLSERVREQRSPRSPVSTRELLGKLLEFDFPKESIVASLQDMLQVDRRLLYTSVREQVDHAESWFSTPAAPVYLTTAGYHYARTLVVSPPYLQWALWQVEQLRVLALSTEGFKSGNMERASSRLRGTLYCLRPLIADEFRRLEGLYRRGGTGSDPKLWLQCTGLSCHSASADILFRTMPTFLHSIAALAARAAESDPALVDDLRSLSGEWIDLGHEQILKHQQLYGDSVVHWEEAISNAEIVMIRSS